MKKLLLRNVLYDKIYNDHRFKDLTGKKFNKLKILRIFGKNKHNQILWLCKCDCGCVKTLNGSSVSRNEVKSCGCLLKDVSAKNGVQNKTHGLTDTKFHNTWIGLKQRCNNINNKRYKNYGGRGITYDPKWSSFLEFKKDMYFKYIYAKKKYRKEVTSKNMLSIERIDVNGNYCKENCTWIPIYNQSKNRNKYT